MSNRPFFKNPARGQTPKFKPYVPQYKVRGLEPEYIASATVPDTMNRVQAIRQPTPRSNDNPRLRPPPSISKNVPYAELPSEVISLGSMPNVGNNIENTWGPNEEYFDLDQSLNVPHHQFIDNNEYDNNNYADLPEMMEAPPTERDITVYDDIDDNDDVGEVASSKSSINGDYILVIKDSIIASGTLEAVEKEVKKLVFGEHPLCKSSEISVDDIVVLKKMKIKVGVFLTD